LSFWVRFLGSGLAGLGERIYEEKRVEWEKVFHGKVIAIETESEQLAGVGETVDDAYRDAASKFPRGRLYFRKVGTEKAAGYLFPS